MILPPGSEKYVTAGTSVGGVAGEGVVDQGDGPAVAEDASTQPGAAAPGPILVGGVPSRTPAIAANITVAASEAPVPGMPGSVVDYVLIDIVASAAAAAAEAAVSTIAAVYEGIRQQIRPTGGAAPAAAATEATEAAGPGAEVQTIGAD